MSWDWDKLKQQQQGRGGGAPPPMDEILDRVKKFKMPGGGPLVILVIVILFIASSTFYTIKQDEVGIVQLFGRYVRTTQPGLNFKLPIGIEKGSKENVKRIPTEEFGFRSSELASHSASASGPSAPVCAPVSVALRWPLACGEFWRVWERHALRCLSTSASSGESRRASARR